MDSKIKYFPYFSMKLLIIIFITLINKYKSSIKKQLPIILSLQKENNELTELVKNLIVTCDKIYSLRNKYNDWSALFKVLSESKWYFDKSRKH